MKNGITNLFIKTSKSNRYMRSYGAKGQVIMSKRGNAVKVMMSFVDGNKPITSAYDAYRRKFGKTVVSYTQYLKIVTAFEWIVGDDSYKSIIHQLNTDPRFTWTYALHMANIISNDKAKAVA